MICTNNYNQIAQYTRAVVKYACEFNACKLFFIASSPSPPKLDTAILYRPDRDTLFCEPLIRFRPPIPLASAIVLMQDICCSRDHFITATKN